MDSGPPGEVFSSKKETGGLDELPSLARVIAKHGLAA